MSITAMTKKLAVVGSSNFPLDPPMLAQVIDTIREYGPEVVLLTRGRGNFDEFLSRAAPLIGLRAFTYPATGGADNWTRDVELVRDADEVLAFLSYDDFTSGAMTGTMHVLDKALDQKKVTRAFTHVEGQLVYAGANEGRAAR